MQLISILEKKWSKKVWLKSDNCKEEIWQNYLRPDLAESKQSKTRTPEAKRLLY